MFSVSFAKRLGGLLFTKTFSAIISNGLFGVIDEFFSSVDWMFVCAFGLSSYVVTLIVSVLGLN